MKTFLVVELTETDGDIRIRRLTAEEIKEYSKQTQEFAVIDGEVLKTVDKKLDIGRLR